ncbi:MAG: YtxH domain-containing protein [Nitrospirota bacterium]
MSEHRNGSYGCVGAAFLIGGAIGAAVALLFAPRSGEETREEIRKFYDRSRSRMGELQEDVADRIARLVDEIQEKTSELLASGKAMAEERKRDLQEAIAIARRALDEERGLLRRIRDRAGSQSD